jgi:hypothetical protein
MRKAPSSSYSNLPPAARGWGGTSPPWAGKGALTTLFASTSVLSAAMGTLLSVTPTRPASSPLWLGMVALNLSLTAVSATIWIGQAQLREQRIMRPNVLLNCSFTPSYFGISGRYEDVVVVSVSKLGAQPTVVTYVHIATPRIVLNGSADCNFLEGNGSFPFRLDGNSGATWAIDKIQERATVSVRCGHRPILTRID